MTYRRRRGPLEECIAGRTATRVARGVRSDRARRKRRWVRFGSGEVVRIGVAFAICLLAVALADGAATVHAPRFGLGRAAATLEGFPTLRACAAARWFDKLPGAVRDPNSRCAGAAEIGFASSNEPPSPVRLPPAGMIASMTPVLVPQVAARDVALELARKDDDVVTGCGAASVTAAECAVQRRPLAF